MLTESFDFSRKYISKFGFPFIELDIPDCKKGKHEIINTVLCKGTKMPAVDMRMSLYSGVEQLKIILVNNLIYTEMKESGSTWVSNHPTEIFSQMYPALKAHGNVLVSGIGIGLIIRLMEKYNSNIKNITVVEKSKSLIHLLKPYFSNINIIHGDIFKYVKTTKEKYDYVYHDVWASTGEYCYYNTVIPLRRDTMRVMSNSYSKEKKFKNIYCWMEEVMKGQVLHAILSPLYFHKDKIIIDQLKKFLNDGNQKSSPILYDFYKTYSVSDFIEFLPKVKGNAQDIVKSYMLNANEVAQDYVKDYELNAILEMSKKKGGER